MDGEVDNVQFVGVRGDDITVMFPHPIMSRRDALVHAAWLVAAAERDDGEFDAILRAVKST